MAYVFVAPAVCLCGLYLSIFLSMNSRQGAAGVSRLVSAIVAGELSFEYLSVGPDLVSARVYDAQLFDLEGRQVIEARTLSCRFSPAGLVRRRIVLENCRAADGRFLVEALPDGGVGFIQAITGAWRPKQNERSPPIIELRDVELVDIDVLVSTPELVLRFDSVDLSGGRLEGGRGLFELDAVARAQGGRIIATERLFGLGDGKASWDHVLWDTLRRNRPWPTAWAEVPDAPEGERGLLDLRLSEVLIDHLRLRGEDIEVDRLLFAGRELSFDGRGLVRLMPEQPKLAPRERAILAYDGHARVSIPADSVVLDWALLGLFGGEGGTLEPFEFDGYGSVRFFDGETHLSAHDLSVGPFRLDRVESGLSWRDGTMRLSDDTTIEMLGGTVTGVGSMVPADGTWQLALCLDDVDLGGLAGTMFDAEGPLAPWLDVTLRTSPKRCAPDVAPGIELAGDLTLKAFELAPAATTPADKEIQAPMIGGSARNLALRWERAPSPMPHRVARVTLGATLDQRGVVSLAFGDVEGLAVRAGEDALSIRGSLDLVALTLHGGRVELRSPSLGRWLARAGVPWHPDDLSVSASFEIAGPVAQPDVDAFRLSARLPEREGGLPGATLEASLDIDGDDLLVSDLSVESSAGDLMARGRVGLFDGAPWRLVPDPSFDTTVVLTGVDIGAIVPSAGVDAQFDATFGLTGTASSPEIRGSHLEVVDFRVLGEPIDYLWIDRYTLSDTLVSIESLLMVKGKGTLEGDVTIDVADGALQGVVHGRRFRLSELRSAIERGIDLAGDADFDLTLGGDFDAPTLAGRVSTERLRLEGVDVGTVAATFYTFDGAVEVAAVVATDFDLEARIPIDGSPQTVGVRFAAMPVDRHLASLQGVFERATVSGRLDAMLDPFGTGRHSATLEVTNLDVRASKRRFDIPHPATVTWLASTEGGAMTHRFSLAGLSIGTQNHYLDIGGTLSLDGEGSDLRLAIDGQSDFSLLRFLPDLIVDAEGLVDVDLRVTGPLEDAAIFGGIEFERARIVPRGLGTPVYFGPGRLRVADDAIVSTVARPLTGTIFGGDFSAWGAIGLRGLVPVSVDYHLFVTNLAYRVPDVMNVTLTSQDLHFVAPDLSDYDTWWLRGDVQIVDARYYENIEVVGSTLSFGGFGRTVDRFSLPIWMREPAVGRLQTDLRLHGRDRFEVQNTIATAEMDLEFRTELQLSGRLEAMELVGEMEALEGSTVTYRGNEFDVKQMTLTFRGDRDPRGYPMPVLDAEVTASIRPCTRRTTESSFDFADRSRPLDETQDVYMTAFVRGLLPSDLSFQLQSTPFYDQRDQLSLILTGCTVDELTAGDAGGRTLEVVLAPVINVVERNVEERLALDTVDLIPTADGSAGISVRDDVSERFTWGLDANVASEAAENRQVVRGEYRLFDWLLIEIQEQTTRSERITVDTGLRFRVKLD